VPRPFGGDRLVEAKDGLVILETRAHKGWSARVPASPVSVEHPGTAVRWEDEFWEVRLVEEGEGVVRYGLAPWDDRHVFRAVSEYSEAAEGVRRAERAELASMTKKRRLSLALALLAGHLPGPVQQRMEQDFGAPAARLTMISAFPLALFGAFCAFWLIYLAFAGGFGVATGDARAMGALPTSTGVLLFGALLGVESAMRAGIAFLQGRPAGSLFGAIAYEVWRRAKREPLEVEWRPARGDVPDDRRLLDAYRMREPLAALLSPAEQVDLAERFGFDPIRWGRRTALLLLSFFGLVGWRAMDLGDTLVLLAATAICLEQVLRIVRLARGEAAGSVLGVFIRPLMRPLFTAPPPGPGETLVPPPLPSDRDAA
jgi:hypothetical protein